VRAPERYVHTNQRHAPGVSSPSHPCRRGCVCTRPTQTTRAETSEELVSSKQRGKGPNNSASRRLLPAWKLAAGLVHHIRRKLAASSRSRRSARAAMQRGYPPTQNQRPRRHHPGPLGWRSCGICLGPRILVFNHCTIRTVRVGHVLLPARPRLLPFWRSPPFPSPINT
jgi:hypothetical protein